MALDFSSARILVVGDVMLDCYVQGAAHKISPEAPVPVVRCESVTYRAGGAANVAINLAAIGAQVSLIGVIGNDDSAKTLKNLPEIQAIDCHWLIANKSTITKTRYLSRHQQLLRIDNEDLPVTHDDISIVLETLLAHVTHVIFSDYAKGALSQVQSLIEMCRVKNKVVLVDPKGEDFSRYKGADWLKPNFSEFSLIAGKVDSENAMSIKATTLREKYHIANLLITRSEDGMSLFNESGELHFPAKAHEVFDVTGAGDTVIALLAAGLAAGYEARRATNIANVAASIVVGKLGTAHVTPDTLNQAINKAQLPDFHDKIVGKTELIDALTTLRAANKRIVMTNGCFDIIHAGHVHYLAQARALGDVLVVATNTDTSITRLKGTNRPINTLESRLAVLAALNSVDFVIAFDQDTPTQLIKACLPDVLVKGGDNDPDTIAGGNEVRENGGEVLVLDYLDGFSTTRAIAKIK